MLGATAVGTAFALMVANKLDGTSSGVNSAISLGADIQRFRTIRLIIMAFLTADLAVSVSWRRIF